MTVGPFDFRQFPPIIHAIPALACVVRLLEQLPNGSQDIYAEQSIIYDVETGSLNEVSPGMRS
jgi:hypothetical protein